MKSGQHFVSSLHHQRIFPSWLTSVIFLFAFFITRNQMVSQDFAVPMHFAMKAILVEWMYGFVYL